jgi:hypothetical protein
MGLLPIRKNNTANMNGRLIFTNNQLLTLSQNFVVKRFGHAASVGQVFRKNG